MFQRCFLGLGGFFCEEGVGETVRLSSSPGREVALADEVIAGWLRGFVA